MLALIRSIHVELRGACGTPKMVREPRGRGFGACETRVERLMHENNIRARHKRRYRVRTDSRHGLPMAPNWLKRDFAPAAPNSIWTLDSTYLGTDDGWLYLAIVLDLFNREVVGWSLKPAMTAELVTDAVTMAWFRRRPGLGVVVHSDRGSQYASSSFQSKLAAYGMTCTHDEP
jgi:putative transposase